MSGRGYGMLYPTPSPSAEIERSWRSTAALPRSTAGSSAHAQATSVHLAHVRASMGGVTAANARSVSLRAR